MADGRCVGARVVLFVAWHEALGGGGRRRQVAGDTLLIPLMGNIKSKFTVCYV